MDFSKKDLNYNDYLEEIRKVKDIGTIKETLEKLPGGEKVDPEKSKEELEKVERIILAMTDEERSRDTEFSNERREELADKAGVDVEEVHKLIRNFARVKLLMGTNIFRKKGE